MIEPSERPFPLLPAIALYVLAAVVLAWPWLSGTVTIPYDAKSQFLPQLAFLARSLAAGESPFWTPNIYAGWPQIADPQSLIFSPPHLLLALIDPRPGFRAVDAITFLLIGLGGLGLLLYFRDRGWHVAGALVAALAFSFGGSCASRLQHTGQIESLAYLPLTLWMLTRALDRSSIAAGAAAGLFAALIAIGRDQVALLGLYVLTGFVLTYWFAGEGRAQRVVASIKPLAAAAVVGALVAAVPVLLTALLAAQSNRPAVTFADAGAGSLPPVTLLMLVFPGLFGAGDFNRDYWGPPSFAWDQVWGETGLFIAQNVGQVYAGAILIVALLGFGIARGLVWSRDIRFFTIAAALVLLYAVGWYTPMFRVMYALMPGVDLFRRPADATFILGTLLAIIAGYLVHRWLSETISPSSPRQRIAEVVVAVTVLAFAIALAVLTRQMTDALPSLLIGIAWSAGAIAALVLARRYRRTPLLAAVLLGAFTTADLAYNVAPDELTGLPPATYDALRPDSTDETLQLIKAELAKYAAPDRRDRVEMIGIAYHWPNLGLIHGFDHLFGHNPLRLADFERATAVMDTVAAIDQRPFSPLYPSYNSPLADLFGVRIIAISEPVETIDKILKPGDLRLIARTKDAYVYENPRALPRVMLFNAWQRADFAALVATGEWPADPRRTVLLEQAPAGFTREPGGRGNGAACALRQHRGGGRGRRPRQRHPGAQ